MDYDFGDILDARNAPDGHFIIVVGEVIKKGQTEVMYYIVTSRVYAVFKDILDFFNNCIQRNDKYFLKHFSKEKAKTAINPHGSLSQAIFLDKHTNYDTCFEVESMIVVNSDPKLMDKTALETLRTDGRVLYKNKLTKVDALNLREVIKHSNDVSPDRKTKILTAFNKVKSSLR